MPAMGAVRMPPVKPWRWTRARYDEAVRTGLLARGVQGGIALKRYLPELEDVALFTTTERHTPEDYAALRSALEALA